MLLLAGALTACVPMPVDTEIDACPATGLDGVAFYAGKPPEGKTIIPHQDQEGRMVWDFSSAEGELYLTCHYGTSVRVQKLPGEMKSCTRSPGQRLRCRAVL